MSPDCERETPYRYVGYLLRRHGPRATLSLGVHNKNGTLSSGAINRGGGRRRPLKCTLYRAHRHVHASFELQTFFRKWVQLLGDADLHRGRILCRRTTEAGRKILIYGQWPLQRATSTLSGYLQDWGPCGQLYSRLGSGTPRIAYYL